MRKLRSFIDIDQDSHFSIYNLPYGVFKLKSSDKAQIGVAIGDYVLNVSLLDADDLIDTPSLRGKNFFAYENTLNKFMGSNKKAWDEARSCIQTLLLADAPTLRDTDRLRDAALIPLTDVDLQMPVQIGDYTDFYSSEYHAANVGTMFRGKENALLPNWKWIPVGYHGRASSIVIDGTPIHRPKGQTKADEADEPVFGPSKLLDFELEMGFFTGTGNELGKQIPLKNAADNIFGMVLVNDWSARDIQKWEYVPLGPFLAKNFATSISPWIVPMAALEPFRCKGARQTPKPLSYLKQPGNRAYDIHLEVHLQSAKMEAAVCISKSNFKHMYWSVEQQLAHHTISGCNVRPGDLLASGTISGPTPDSYGSMLELAWRGTKPIKLSKKEERKFLLDGDKLTLTGWCQGDGYRVGFGEVSGEILPPTK